MSDPSAPSDPSEPERPGTSEPPDEAADADAWQSAVDHPESRPQMGFTASSERSPGRADESQSGFPDLGALMEQFVSGVGGARGTSGGAGTGVPDLAAMVQRLLGGDVGQTGLSELVRGLGMDPSDSALVGALQSQIRAMFSPQTDQTRRDMASDIARKTAASSEGDAPASAIDQREVSEAVKVAQLWIDPVTDLDPADGTAQAWSRAEWVAATMPTWHGLVDPVAKGVVRAIASALKGQVDKLAPLAEMPEGFPGIPGLDASGLIRQLQPFLEQLAGSLFSVQIGQAVGALASDLLTGTEVGLPLLGSSDVVLLPAAVTKFAEGLGIDPGEVRLYLGVREAARTRLFAAVPWLGPQLEAAVRDYASNITIDTDAIEESVRSIDMSNPAALQEALQDIAMFAPTPTPAQRDALVRLETSLALVEGWVDLVTEQATAAHLPHVAALGEAMRRRRAGGPAEKTFSGLVGLELRPRRLKDAKNLWAALQDAGGVQFRDAPWKHPDIAPTAADLDDPLGFVEKRRAGGKSDDMDTAPGCPPSRRRRATGPPADGRRPDRRRRLGWVGRDAGRGHHLLSECLREFAGGRKQLHGQQRLVRRGARQSHRSRVLKELGTSSGMMPKTRSATGFTAFRSHRPSDPPWLV